MSFSIGTDTTSPLTNKTTSEKSDSSITKWTIIKWYLHYKNVNELVLEQKKIRLVNIMRLKHVIPYFIFAIMLSACSTSNAPNLTATPDLTMPIPGRLRAGYMAASNISLLPRMSQVGMNAAIPKFDILSVPLTSSVVDNLRAWAKQCNQNNILFMPVLNWWDASQALSFPNYNHVVTDTGIVLAKTPCPYTQSFWDNWIMPRLIEIVNAVEGLPLGAVLIDMEMYGVEYTSYNRGCYCDECFSRYMKAKGLSEKLPAITDRANMVKNASDLKFYESLQREAARAFAVTLRDGVHKLRPGLRLGALHLDDTVPLQQGIAMGFGTPRLPVFCFTEATYSNGYTPYVASVQQYFRDMGAYVDLLVGIWQSRFPPENIPEQLYYCAHDSYGYWIYTMETFADPAYHPLPGTLDEGWNAIQRADQELDKLRIDQGYQTSLKIRPFDPPPTSLP